VLAVPSGAWCGGCAWQCHNITMSIFDYNGVLEHARGWRRWAVEQGCPRDLVAWRGCLEEGGSSCQ
jgi:hypothetical protein